MGLKVRERLEAVTHVFSDKSTELEAQNKDGSEQDKKAKYRQLIFIVLTVVIAFLDVVTDWYNWYKFRSYTQSIKEDNLEDDYDLNGFTYSYLVISTLGTIWFILEAISAYGRFRTIRNGKQLTHKSVAMESCIMLMVSLSEDFPTTALFFAALMKPVCPVMEQAASLAGKLTLITAALSALWKLMLVCCCCCCCGCRNDAEEKCKANCAWCCKCCIRMVRIPVQLATLIFVIVIMASIKAPSLGKEVDKDGSLVLHQMVTGIRYQPPSQSDSCKEFTIQTNLTMKLSQLQELSGDGIWMKMPCNKATPYYEVLGNPEEMLSSTNCDIIVHLKYNKVYARVIYQTFLQTGDSSSCSWTPLLDPGDSEFQPVTEDKILSNEALAELCGGQDCFSSSTSGFVSTSLRVKLLGNVYKACRVTVARSENPSEDKCASTPTRTYNAVNYIYKPCED